MSHITDFVRWHLHLGVHKTATTHIQQTLVAAKLQAVSVVPLSILRPATQPVLDHGRFFKGSRFKKSVAQLVGKQTRIVLSEENWLGHAHEGCAFPPYPNAMRRLKAVKALNGNKQAFLAVRHPADFAASIYSEAIRHHPDLVSLKEVKAHWLEGGSPWFELVGRIGRYFPLRIWRYEDYRDNRHAILCEITGSQGPFPDIPDPPSTKRISHEAVEAIEEAREKGWPLPDVSRLLVDRGRRFEMFTPEERDWLGKAYERDLCKIEYEMDGVLMRFPSLSSNRR